MKDNLHELKGEKPFKCDQCTSTFSRICGLSDHKAIHTGILLACITLIL